jgi:transcriptional regulator with XRE-family HTH domain
VGQQTISSVESGTSQLTLKTAERLAPVLGRDVDAAELCAFEDVARMRRLALKGAISPEQVLAVIQNLIAAAAEEDEESAREIDGELTRALLSVLRLALRTYDGSSAVASVSSAATKSARPDGTRDSYGRRTSKPFAPANAEALPGGGVPAPEAALKSRTATRDRDGRRIDKPFAPRGR